MYVGGKDRDKKRDQAPSGRLAQFFYEYAQAACNFKKTADIDQHEGVGEIVGDGAHKWCGMQKVHHPCKAKKCTQSQTQKIYAGEFSDVHEYAFFEAS